MQKVVVGGFARKVGGLGLALALAACVPMASFATDPVVDYSALSTATKTETIGAISSSAPVAFALLAVLLGVGIAWRMIKKAAKSS